MAKRAGRAFRSVWERRRQRWLAGFGAVVVVAVVVGVVGVSGVLAGPPPPCTPQAPTNTVLPAMTPTGYGSYGTGLSTTTGTWQANCSPMVAPTYQWYRGTNAISGETSNSYTTGSGDGSSQITVQVTRCDTYGNCTEATATGTFQHSVAPTPGTVAITGTAQSGQTLTATASGFGLGTPAGQYVYKWYRCTNATDTPGSGTCTHVDWTSSSTSSTTDTYTAVANDVNYYIKVVATVTNTCSSGCTPPASATSSAKGPVLPAAPSGGSVLISGVVELGNTLTATACSDQGWSPSVPAPSCAYQWQVSANGTSGWANATGSGATTASYTIASTDVGQYLRVTVTATNPGGSNVTSDETSSADPGPTGADGPNGAAGPTGGAGPSGAFGPTGANGFSNQNPYGPRTLQGGYYRHYAVNEPEIQGTRASFLVNAATPDDLSCLLFDSVVAEQNTGAIPGRQFQVGLAQCGNNAQVDNCSSPMQAGLYGYVEYINATGSAAICVPEGTGANRTGSVNAAQYHQLELTKLNKKSVSDWEATLAGKTVTNPRISFDKYVDIFEWGEVTRRSWIGPCIVTSWGATANITGWQSYRIGVGWETIKHPTVQLTNCTGTYGSTGTTWTVGNFLYNPSKKAYHFTVYR